MKKIILFTFIIISSNSFSQKVEGTELGIDGFFGASNLGGSFGLGPKFGFRFNENFIAGPSFRFQRTWSKGFGNNFAYNIFGGGVFAHARYKNILFGGVEFEMLKSPKNYTSLSAPKSWVPTLFICGGFSKEFNESIRLNVGMYYDVINSVNSPFRQAYFLTSKDANGQIVKYIPLIYRISFFFRLGK